MTNLAEESVREAWVVLQAVRVACERRVRDPDHRPLIATLCYDPSEPERPYAFGFANSRGEEDELPFLMLCEQAVTAAQTIGIGGILPAFLSAAGQWCLIMTRVMPLPHPLHHGVWVNSKQIDPADQVFHEFPDVFTMTAQAIGFVIDRHLAQGQKKEGSPPGAAGWDLRDDPLHVPPDLISLASAAALVPCSRRTIQRRIRGGVLREYRPGFVSQSEVNAKRLQLLLRWGSKSERKAAARNARDGKTWTERGHQAP